MQKLILLATLSLFSFRTFAQSTAFTYQGRLQDGGNPATGLYDFEFRLFDASLGGAQQGPTVTLNDLGVTNGRLSPCPDSPNCVSTQATSASQQMLALAYTGTLLRRQKYLPEIERFP